jgi:tetratricopeptide (TPR) repeat protein
MAYYYSGDAGKAIADFTRAQRLRPGDPDVYLNRGMVYSADGDFKRGLADLSEAIRLNPKSAEAHNHRGAAYLVLNELDNAIADYSKAIRLDPEDPSGYFDRARVYERMGDYQKAIADFRDAIHHGPQDAASYDALAWICATCPDQEFLDGPRAVKYATRACQLSDWNDPDFLDTLAAAHAECGEFRRAIQLQVKVLKAREDPETIEAGRERMRLYQAGKPYREQS